MRIRYSYKEESMFKKTLAIPLAVLFLLSISFSPAFASSSTTNNTIGSQTTHTVITYTFNPYGIAIASTQTSTVTTKIGRASCRERVYVLV